MVYEDEPNLVDELGADDNASSRIFTWESDSEDEVLMLRKEKKKKVGGKFCDGMLSKRLHCIEVFYC